MVAEEQEQEQEGQDNIAGAPNYAIKLPAFEGPLDLLLFLVRKHEVDIYDIPIHSVTQQYLQILSDYQKLNLEIAGEFFVMAATLMQIKSSMLLPKDEQLVTNDEEEEADPRWHLIQQLIEYKKFKDAAYTLEDLANKQLDYIPRDYRERAEDKPKAPLKSSDKIELWNVFNLVLRRVIERIGSVGEVHDEKITVADRMEFVLEKITTEKEFLFSTLFKKGDSIAFIVASFLAILELTRLKELVLDQAHNFQDIQVRQNPNKPTREDGELPETSEFDEENNS